MMELSTLHKHELSSQHKTLFLLLPQICYYRKFTNPKSLKQYYLIVKKL